MAVDYTYDERKDQDVKSGSNDFNQFWWEEPEGSRHKSICAVVKNISENQRDRISQYFDNIRLYGVTGFPGVERYRFQGFDQPVYRSRLRLNIIRSMCDTITNKTAKNKILPTFLTEGGDWGKKREAQKLQRFVEGVMYHEGVHEKGKRAFLHSTILGRGGVKIFKDMDFRGMPKICIEPFFRPELLTDSLDGIYGDPKSRFQYRTISRAKAKRMFPDFKKEIEMADPEKDSFSLNSHTSDSILVVEAWRLPTSENASDGVHSIVINGADLLNEEYRRDKYPLVLIDWSDAILGDDPMGIADQLIGIQFEINKTLETIRKSLHLCAVPRVFMDLSSKVIKSHFNNQVGSIVTFRGTAPEIKTFQSVPQELWIHLDFLYQKAFEIIGISQLSAQSIKPQGLDSGKALRTFNDIESDRFTLRGQAWEDFFMDVSEHIIELAKEISEEHPDFGVMAIGKHSTEFIKFKDVNLDRDKYVMKVFPRSGFSETPSARLQEVKEVSEMGALSPESTLKLLDFPDLDSTVSLKKAQLDNVEMIIEQLLEPKGDFMAPDPIMNLTMAIPMIQSAYFKAKNDRVPEKILERFRIWLAQAGALLQMAQPPAPVGPAPQPTAEGVPAL